MNTFLNSRPVVLASVWILFAATGVSARPAHSSARLPPQRAQVRSDYPAPVEADFVAHGFKFGTGEELPELKLHYRTIGTPQRDASGVVRNAVLILHGTGGSGAGFLSA